MLRVGARTRVGSQPLEPCPMQTVLFCVGIVALVTAGLLACHAWYFSRGRVQRRSDELIREERLAAARNQLWDETQT